ncbi:ABC transporter permease [Haloechinothrix sp. LS1_15]|uniref:ABC transporter permease n=1 Tax=Haloechinothrix sp. LS1_15 TaxID=2652248 RepID=UPI002945D743|nr:ABC transporter permease [Haloechinothrix sp. LS1_15]MDV6011017.1 ABC transporter permease [Haloechinothrix sp. LS1_15]
MSTLTLAMQDSATMLRRNLRRQVRYVSLVVFQFAIPIVFLLLFVYVLGGTMGAGLGDGPGSRAEYLDYVTPAVLLIAIVGVAQITPIMVAMDMTGGIIDRFRTMPIARVSVLTGHVLGSLIQTVIVVFAVLGVALLLGFEATAGPAEWVAMFGVVVMVALAITWLSVALGLAARSVETASNVPLPLILLPFLSSGFVPVDSMPAAMRWFAEYQPFTPIIEVFRGLLTASPIGNYGVIAVAWSAGIALLGYVWAKRLFNRASQR